MCAFLLSHCTLTIFSRFFVLNYTFFSSFFLLLFLKSATELFLLFCHARESWPIECVYWTSVEKSRLHVEHLWNSSVAAIEFTQQNGLILSSSVCLTELCNCHEFIPQNRQKQTHQISSSLPPFLCLSVCLSVVHRSYFLSLACNINHIFMKINIFRFTSGWKRD